MVLDPARVVTALSAALALLERLPAARSSRWWIHWPVPIIGLALVLAVGDLAALAGGRQTSLGASELLLGVWAAGVVIIAGILEITYLRRGGEDGRGLAAPALLIAAGAALMLDASSSGAEGGLASGTLVLIAGVLLAWIRTDRSPVPALHTLWPAALIAGVIAYRPPPAPDALAQARVEMGLVLAELARDGTPVQPIEAGASVPHLAQWPVQAFRVGSSTVLIYLVSHDEDSRSEVHLSPRPAAPPPIGGVPHLHAGPHILVVCITADSGLPRQLERIVHGLGGRRHLRSFAAVGNPPA